MKTITYAGDRFLTGDAIATAVMDYARALARSGDADTVEIPVRDDAGGLTVATLLIGPASQIAAEETDDPHGELHDEAVVADLAHRSRAAETHAAVIDDADGPGSLMPDFDYDDHARPLRALPDDTDGQGRGPHQP